MAVSNGGYYGNEYGKLSAQVYGIIRDHCPPSEEHDTILEKLEKASRTFTVEELQEIVQALSESYDSLWENLPYDQQDYIRDEHESILEIPGLLDNAFAELPTVEDNDENAGQPGLTDLDEIDEIVEGLVFLANEAHRNLY